MTTSCGITSSAGLSPRLRGTDSSLNWRSGSHGLSPRLRGNRIRAAEQRVRGGSIPAPAGEPRPGQGSRCGRRVYPRACGGTCHYLINSLRIGGLSPRLRGNLVEGVAQVKGGGSIPAPAGEPVVYIAPVALPAVYPRACGGTFSQTDCTTSVAGLSPRLRGNPPADGRVPVLFGVYPRACGGTAALTNGRILDRGLSPRLRGNRQRAGEEARQLRSIPAPAGEPGRRKSLTRPTSVYPRACGGTIRYLQYQ